MIGHDGPEGDARRNKRRRQHVAYWSALADAGRVTLAGPIRTDADDASNGVVVVFEATDLEQARNVVNSDPYVYGGVFESLTVATFKCVFPKRP